MVDVSFILMVLTNSIVSDICFIMLLQDGRTPLHICCIKGKVQIVRSLIEHGANATAKDNVRTYTCDGKNQMVIMENT